MGSSLADLGVHIDFKEAKDLLVKSFENTFNVIYDRKMQEILYAS
jgi:hypothetical protein